MVTNDPKLRKLASDGLEPWLFDDYVWRTVLWPVVELLRLRLS